MASRLRNERGAMGAVVLMVIGVLLIAGGAVVKWIILPGQAQFPDDVDTTRTYEGTLATMLNPTAFEALDLANLFFRDLPVTIERTVTTEEVDGGKALVRDRAQLKAPTGDTIMGSDDYYTIDRKSMEAIPNFTDNAQVIDRTGLVVGFPIGTEKQDYVGWNGDTLATETVSFVREEERAGIDTYYFESASEPKVVNDPVLLSTFPTELPKALIAQLAPVLGVPAELQAQLGALLPSLPDPIPLTYTYAYSTQYWIEPATGILIDYAKTEARQVGIDPGTGPAPIATVFDLSYTQSDSSVADAKADAEDGKSLLNLFGTIVPWSAWIVGLLLLIGGFVMNRRTTT